MKINIIRQKSTPEGTPGKLTTDGGFGCDTLELQWANNRTGVSCINSDMYDAAIWHSDNLGHDVVRLEDKHGRKDCLLHNANFAGEGAGEITQIHGCTAVGHGYSQIPKPDGSGHQFGICGSVAPPAALSDPIRRPGNPAITVRYAWADGCAPADLTDAQVIK